MSSSIALNGANNTRAGPSRQTGRPSLSTRSERIQAGSPLNAPQTEAGSSRLSASQLPRRQHHDDPVRAAQDQATRVWRADMRSLLERAEQRFADVCWTTAPDDALDHRDLDSELGHSAYAASSTTSHTNSDTANNALIPPPHSTIPGASANSDTLIWAHKAILYARAPNSFQTRFLNLRAPAAQLQHIGSTASLVSLPLHRSDSELSLASNFSSSTQTGAVQAPTANGPAARSGMPAHPRRSIRGAAPPSSFSMKKPSLRKPISRSSISRPLRKGSIDEFNSIASGYATSDSEGEAGSTVSLRTSRLINAGPIPTATRSARLTSPSKASQSTSSGPVTNVPTRKPSFASVTSTAESHTTYAKSSSSDVSTVRTPISLKGVSPAFFEATLQYLYTGEEAMVDAFEFLFEDRLASGVEITPEEKLDKLRSDLTFMWRSKLFSDVKLVLGDDDVDEKSDGEVASSIINKGRRRGDGRAKMMDIPDANMSVLSLAQTIDTDGLEESDAEDDELTSFSTHRMILASRSEYFASLLLSPYADSRAPVLHLPSPPFTPASLHFTLGFIYTGTLFFSNRTFDLSTAFSLWRAGAYLQMETLQTLVVALIDREFCHGFACSPPCRKCVKRVPRALAFATSPDVSEQALQDSALAAVSGLHFGMYWAKDVGNLDVMLQDRIVESISDRLAQDPTLVVSVLRQLSIVGQRIDTERSVRWVESLRLMAETVSNRVMPILHNHLDTIVTSPAWSDLLDGVGSLGDVLEKCLVMLIDGLTEARAAQIYQTLVGQVLLREQGFEVAQSRQAVESARGSILRYLRKRWINVRALAGFNKLEKWCLKEIADELEVTTTELYLAEVPPSVKSTTLPGRLMAAKRSSSLGGGAAAAVERRSSAVGQRSSLGVPAEPSRTRISSPVSTAAAPARAAPVARKSTVTNDGEREAGPIHMRAAVLNRNAAKVSVANGHRSLCSSASNASVASQTAPVSTSPNGAASTTPKRMIAAGTASSTARSTVTTSSSSTPRSSAADGNARPVIPSAAPISKTTRTRTASATSTSSVMTARSTNGRTAAVAATAVSGSHVPAPLISPSATLSSKSAIPTRATPSSSPNKTPTKTIRPIRSATTLPRHPATTTVDPAPAVSLDSAAIKPTTKTASLSHKSSFLRATPLPGGTFSLSSTDSGADLRARTLSNGSSRKPGSARSITPTNTGGRERREEGMPVDAVERVERAKMGVERSESQRTIVMREDGEEEVEGGIRLRVGIACIVSLPTAVAGSMGGTATVQQKRSIATRTTVKAPSISTTRSLATKPSPKTVRPSVTAIRKYRAHVHYLGPLHTHPGVWVGITLPLPTPPLPPSTAILRPQNGILDGTRYFPSRHDAQRKEESPQRLVRRKQVWAAVNPGKPFSSAPTTITERKEGQETLELFVRPEAVVWVVQ